MSRQSIHGEKNGILMKVFQNIHQSQKLKLIVLAHCHISLVKFTWMAKRSITLAIQKLASPVKRLATPAIQKPANLVKGKIDKFA